MLQLQKTKPFTLIVLSPSISKEGVFKKSLLAPVVIVGPGYQPGLLTSGSTKWPGIVANTDLLPTLLNIAGLTANRNLSGRPLKVILSAHPLIKLNILNARLMAINQNQRSLLDWYMGIISVGWLLGLVCWYCKRR